jgi:hypothetical protein
VRTLSEANAVVAAIKQTAIGEAKRFLGSAPKFLQT